MADRTPGHRTITVDVDAPRDAVPETGVRIPWFVVAGLGGVAVVAAGWLLMAGAAMVGWLTSPETELSSAFDLATDMMLLTHGATVTIGGQLVSIPPLTLSIALVLLGQPIAAFAASQAAAAGPASGESGEVGVDPSGIVWRVMGVFTVSWLLGAAVVAWMGAQQDAFGPVLVGAATMAVVSGGWGAARALNHDPRDAWPPWLRAVPTAMAMAVGACLVAGATLLATTLLVHRERIALIHDSLDPGAAGTALLVLMQVLYLPNLMLWATAWSLGAGVTLGDGSLVSMAITDVGFLPAIPVLGAIPEAGPGSALWLWWLAGGVAGGALAAFCVAWARPGARFDETALVGGLAGVAGGVLVTLAASLASGGLGTERLVHLGARVSDLVIVAPSLMGLVGVVVGLGVGLARGWQRGDGVEEELP